MNYCLDKIAECDARITYMQFVIDSSREKDERSFLFIIYYFFSFLFFFFYIYISRADGGSFHSLNIYQKDHILIVKC
jgi:hypothetical protein